MLGAHVVFTDEMALMVMREFPRFKLSQWLLHGKKQPKNLTTQKNQRQLFSKWFTEWS